MKQFIIGAGVGVVVTMYLMNRKYNKTAPLNQSVDSIHDNIKRFVEQSGIEGDAQKIADDLVGKDIGNAEYSNYKGDMNIKSRRYVLG